MWTKVGPIGNLYKASISQIWNGKIIINLRKKIYQDKYDEVCNSNYCPFMKRPINLSSLKTDSGFKNIIEQTKNKKSRLTNKPIILSLAHSGECNLRCIMCMSRIDHISKEPKLTKIVFDKVIPFLMPDLQLIRLNGNGDPFFQKETREFLQKFNSKKHPNIKFEILTNGILLNEKLWDTIKHNNFESVNVSIDAASKEVYEKIRKRGKWEILNNNLKFISKLRKAGKIEKFYINMTVMKSNIKDLEKFADFGLSLGCDGIFYSKIFGTENLNNPQENINEFPYPKDLMRIKKILKNPIFDNKKVKTEQIEDYLSYKSNLMKYFIFYHKLSIFKLKAIFKTIIELIKNLCYCNFM